MWNQFKRWSGYLLPGIGMLAALPEPPTTVAGWVGVVVAVLGGPLGVHYVPKPK